MIPDQPTVARRPRVVFLLLPRLHMQDLAGPAQVFYEAAGFGAGYELVFAATVERVCTAQGLVLADLVPPPEPRPTDRVIVPGIDSAELDRLDAPFDWLRAALGAGCEVGSICSGAFALARAGLLDGRRCTTHWKIADRLEREYPRARVHDNRLFVRDGRVVTSAGVTAGIDLALSLVREDCGPRTAALVAREMVVYLRREGEGQQLGAFLEHRTHLHPGVHRVQDWLTEHPDRNATLDELGRIAGMSARNLTRVFRRATGITLKEFSGSIKLEVASRMLERPDLSIDAVAERCGFRDPRQLRRLWKRRHGTSLQGWRALHREKQDRSERNMR
ncbi:MAG TPA: DJ-1/PfpI family protein [Candidatus Polarisedimenticolaceae bacterium]|nr:DJ-1/PfpI family protein [Candidatus Polarisedimenticolaceae bacterium]